MAKVLVIEDDKFLLKVYQVKLEKVGFETIVLENGSGALEIVKKENPDLILLDIIMPKKDGFATLRDLKSESITKDIPVIMLTALSTPEDEKKAIDLGATKYLVKTDHSFQDVIDMIEDLLN